MTSRPFRAAAVRAAAAVAAAALAVAGCTSGSSGPGGSSAGDAARTGTGAPVQALVKGLAAPWGIAFLPGGDALVTERDSGRILRVSPAGAVTQVQRLSEVDASGEGGLLGIAVAPTYATDRWVYVYYTSGPDNRIARLRLGGRPEPLVTGIPVSGIHNGGRLAFGPDGMLYAGTGDASQRGRSQDVASLGGKVLRMTPDGEPAPGNPFPGSLVWTLGHRNVQGLAWDSAGRLWASEFGQSQFDEVNLLEPGRNYGWPEVEGRSDRAEFVQPLVTWPTSAASPSGVAVLGDSLYVAALRGERLWRVPLDGNGGVGEPEALLSARYGRLRAVAVAPDRSLWVLTSNRDGRGDPVSDDDRILRFVP